MLETIGECGCEIFNGSVEEDKKKGMYVCSKEKKYSD